jgi:hypothetical protein
MTATSINYFTFAVTTAPGSCCESYGPWIVPDPDHEDHDAKCRYLSGSVRLRLPMIGGGSFEKLMPALIDGIRGEWERYKQATKKEPSHG